MNSQRLILSTGAAFLALGLTACGGGGGVSIGAEGATASDGSGGQVELGADGATLSDGNGNQVILGSDGATASAADGSQASLGADGASVSAGGGAGSASAGGAGGMVGGGGVRQGTFGTTGQVSLAGAISWQGQAGGSCDVNADQRTVTSKLQNGYTLVVDTNGPGQVTLTVRGSGGMWQADFNGDGESVLTMTPGRTVVSGANLAGPGDGIQLDASFSC
jgi:hypothetical protein